MINDYFQVSVTDIIPCDQRQTSITLGSKLGSLSNESHVAFSQENVDFHAERPSPSSSGVGRRTRERDCASEAV